MPSVPGAKVRIINETRYRTSDLKSFFAAGLKAMGVKSNKIITVRYTRPGPWRRRAATDPECQTFYKTTETTASYAGGRAYLGRTVVRGKTALGLPKRVLLEARHMTILLPPPGIPIDYRDLALTLEHEVLHLKGVQHKDMTNDQRYCRGPLPPWANDWFVRTENQGIRLEPESAPLSSEERTKRRDELIDQRAAKARAKLEAYERKTKRIQALCKKWREKVRYYDRRMVAKKGGSS